MLTKPDFKLPSPNPRASNTTDQVWWLRCHMLALEQSTRDGGTYANKAGFHNKGSQVRDYGAGNSSTDYSIRDAVNRSGVWRTHSSAWDWTFTTAQGGNYALIDKYTSRLVSSSLNGSDPRLDLILFEFYGQADSDSHVEGYDEYHERDVTSDSSHLWHIHMSFRRSKVNDWWGMWALYTVLTGQSVAVWRATLPDAPPPAPAPRPPSSTLPKYTNGSRQLTLKSPNMRGTDVQFVQKWIGPARAGTADGIFGAQTKAAVLWYQRMRGLSADGIVGPRTWAAMGVRR